jgi:hypothetical protein
MDRRRSSTVEHGLTTPDYVPLIQASELAQYSYCRRAWWLEIVKKIAPSNQPRLAHGLKVHARHGGWTQAAIYWRRRGFLLIGTGSLFFIIALVWLWLAG